MLILITMKEIHQLLCPLRRQLIDCRFKLISSINEVSYFQIKNYGSNSTYIKNKTKILYIYIYGVKTKNKHHKEATINLDLILSI